MAMATCSSANGKSGTFTGVSSEIEWVNSHLCVQTGNNDQSWSLSWVSLDGPNSDSIPGISIYQGGFAKCASVDTTCDANGGVSYHWVYYAREQGPCGDAYVGGHE